MHETSVNCGKEDQPENQEQLIFFQVQQYQLDGKGVINRFQVCHLACGICGKLSDK
jgi:hypothetical protein